MALYISSRRAHHRSHWISISPPPDAIYFVHDIKTHVVATERKNTAMTNTYHCLNMLRYCHQGDSSFSNPPTEQRQKLPSPRSGHTLAVVAGKVRLGVGWLCTKPQRLKKNCSGQAAGWQVLCFQISGSCTPSTILRRGDFRCLCPQKRSCSP